MAASTTNFGNFPTKRNSAGHSSDENVSSNETEVGEEEASVSPEVTSDENDESTVLAQDLKAQGSVIVKNERKRGRRSCWPDTFVNEVVEVICEKQHYRKKLIYTNNKASKNLELYTEIVEAVKQKCKERGKLFNFSPVQTRTKFKACVAACKKAAMTRRYGSGLSNYLTEQPSWFQKLFPFIESRDSCDPTLATEPSFELLPRGSTSDDDESNQSSVIIKSDPGKELVPKRKKDLFDASSAKRVRKESPGSLMKEAVTAFNKFVAKDPSQMLMQYFTDENERMRQHEKDMMQMQMQMFQSIMLSFHQQGQATQNQAQFAQNQAQLTQNHGQFTQNQLQFPHSQSDFF